MQINISGSSGEEEEGEDADSNELDENELNDNLINEENKEEEDVKIRNKINSDDNQVQNFIKPKKKSKNIAKLDEYEIDSSDEEVCKNEYFF